MGLISPIRNLTILQRFHGGFEASYFPRSIFVLTLSPAYYSGCRQFVLFSDPLYITHMLSRTLESVVPRLFIPA